MANWITEGDPGMDIWAMDASRFGDWATVAYTNAKVRENHSRRFEITFPNEELPAGRPLHTTALYDRYTEANAVWGVSLGLEVALWFQDPGREPVEEITSRRSNAFPVVAAECAAVRNRLGITETSGFAKYRVEGQGAGAWLDRILANRIPPPGRITLGPMLNHQGKLIGDFNTNNQGTPSAAARPDGQEQPALSVALGLERRRIGRVGRRGGVPADTGSGCSMSRRRRRRRSWWRSLWTAAYRHPFHPPHPPDSGTVLIVTVSLPR